MAASVTQIATGPGGEPSDKRENNGLLSRAVTITGDASYPTGGYPITAAALGFPNAVSYGQAEIQSAAGQTGTAASILVQANGSILFKLWSNANAEVANASAQASVWQVILWGW